MKAPFRAALFLAVLPAAASAYAQSWDRPVVLGVDPDAPPESAPAVPDSEDELVVERSGTVRRGVNGRIIDVESKQPLAGAAISVRGTDIEVKTDADGRFALPLAVGKYELRVRYPLYEGKRIKNVVITGGALSLNIPLRTSNDAIEEVVVLGEPERQTEKGVLELRKRSSTMSDALSAQEMSRTPDSSASDAVKRVVSATVIDNRYVYIRGLGDRYVTTLLNGVTLPSPEPDRQAVPLDLFPTSLLANLTIAKSYSATHPGTFGGGTLSIETNTYPKKFTVSAKVSTSANSVSTGKDQFGYTGGNLDMFGFDDGTRALPAAVPRDRPLDPSAGFDRPTMEQIGRSFSNNWRLKESTSYPNLGAGITVGDTVKPGGRPLGYLASLNFGRRFAVRNVEAGKVTAGPGGMGVIYREQNDITRGENSAQLGGLLATGYEISPNHGVDLFTLYTHSGESVAQRTDGFSDTDLQTIQASRLQFNERFLSFSQIQTRHRFPGARNLELKLQGNVSFTSADEPDTRDIVYHVLEGGEKRFKSESGSGERFFSELRETTFGTGVDATLPVVSWLRIKAGGTAERADREFSARQFRLGVTGNTNPMSLRLGPEAIFAPENIGPEFLLREETQASDAYDASRNVFAGYTSSELQLTDKLRSTLGVRYEAAHQEVSSGSPFAAGISMPRVIPPRDDNDFLPSASTVYALTPSMNLRAAYSRTLARPRFRELADFVYFDYTRRRNVSGNPELETTRIHNGDVRWEWFLGDTDLVAASAFYKKFQDPIEMVIYGADNGDVQPMNAAGATVKGLEVEARTSLAALHRTLRDVRAWGNVSIIDSEIALRPEQVRSQTNSERPLQGQSPYVLNLGLGYDNRGLGTNVHVLYNVFGRRLAEVGYNGLPDVYERPLHRVDAAAGKKIGSDLELKLAVTNLLNQSMDQEQGGLLVERVRPGVSVSLSLSWTP